MFLYCVQQELRQRKDEEQHKHAIMLEAGKKIAELSDVDVDKEYTNKLNQITEKWKTLWEKCDKWYEDVTAIPHSDITKQDEKSEVSKLYTT